MKFFLCHLIYIFLITSLYSQQQVILNPVKDNTLYETVNGSTSNGAGDFLFVGRVASSGGGAIRRALLKFDVASSVPSGAVIIAATLTMRMSKTIAGAATVKLQRVTSEWGEGTSNANANEGTGAASTNSDATWLHKFFNISLWTNSGGDYSSTISGSNSVDVVGNYNWGKSAQMISDVQEWLNNPETNFGWIMIGDESTEATAKRFDSRQNPTVANRPTLTIVYSLPTSVYKLLDNGNPKKFSLHQNYPNPFNPVTSIKYQLPEASNVSLIVFDMLGREIANLVNEKQEAGTYAASFDAERLASGIYFYRLTAGSFVSTKRMILIR